MAAGGRRIGRRGTDPVCGGLLQQLLQRAGIGQFCGMERAQQRHFGGDQRIGRGAHLVMALEQQLPQPVDLPGGKPRGPLADRLALLLRYAIGLAASQLR